MATVPVAGYVSYASTVNHTSHPFTLPGGIPSGGYKAYIMVSWGGGSATTISSFPGWTLVDGPFNVNNSITNAIYSKAVGPSDSGTTQTVTPSGGCAMSIAGVIALANLDVLGTHASDGALINPTSLPAITPGDVDCLLLYFVCAHHPSSTVTGMASFTSGLTQRVDQVTLPTTQAMPESVLLTKQLTGQNGIAQPAASITWNDTVRTNKWTMTLAPITAPTNVRETDRFGRLSGAVYFRYKTGQRGSVSPIGTLKPMLVGASHSFYDDLNTKLNNPSGSKPGGINTGMSVNRDYETHSWPLTWSQSVSAGNGDVGDRASMWSMSDTSWIDTFATGSENTHLITWFNSIPAGHTVWCIFWHEVDLHYRTFATYRAAFANIKAAADASSRDPRFVKVGGLLTSGAFRNGDGDQYFDGSHEFVGIDMYHYYDSDPASPYYGHYAQRTPFFLANQAVSKAAQLGIPWIVGEVGMHPDPNNPTQRPTQINTDWKYFDDNHCSAVCWFHSNVGTRGPWWLDSYPNWADYTDHTSIPDPDSLAAYRTQLASHVRYTEGLVVP